MYSSVPNNRGSLNKRGGPPDNLNINKQGVSNKRRGGGGSEKFSWSEVATRYH